MAKDINHHTDTSSFNEAKGMLEMLYKDKDGGKIVIMLYGGPGIGKTALVKLAAQEAGMDVVGFNAAEHAKEDLSGIPFAYKPKDTYFALKGKEPMGWSHFLPPKSVLELTKEYHDEQRAMHNRKMDVFKKRARDYGEAGKAKLAEKYERMAEQLGEYPEPNARVLFLDEFPNAPKDVQTTYHSLLLERKFGEGYTLLDNVRLTLAGNRKSDGANVHDMSWPLKTRMTHITVLPTHKEFLQYARSVGFYPPLIAFIQSHEANLNLAQEDVSNKDVLTTAVQRTWEMASDLCVITDRAGLDEGTRSSRLASLVTGTIGPKAAANFIQFLRTAREAPSADQILAGPDKVDIFTDKPDIAFTVVETMLAAVRRDPKKYIHAFMRYSKRMHKTYRAIFEPSLVNLQGGMDEEVILLALDSPEAGGLYGMADDFARASAAGDEESKDHKATLDAKRKKALANAKKQAP